MSSSSPVSTPGPTLLAAVTVALLSVACSAGESSNQVTVVGNDYVFQAPDTLPSGPTTFTFENQGEVRHEVILVRLTEGTTMEQVMKAVQGEADPSTLMEGGLGILVAEPGQTTATGLHADLMPGRTYALICNLTDGPEEVPHTQLGMRDSFYVPEGAD